MLKTQFSLKLSHPHPLPRIRGVIIVVPGFEMQNHCTFLTSLFTGWWNRLTRQCNG